MSEIKKELKLVASLDETKLRSQIQALKKAMGEGLSFKTQDLQGLEKAFDKIADRFAQRINKAIAGVKASDSKTGVSLFKREDTESARSTTKLIKKEESERIKMEKNLSGLRQKQQEEELRNWERKIRSRMGGGGAVPPGGPNSGSGAGGNGWTAGSMLKTAGKVGAAGTAAALGYINLARGGVERENRLTNDVLSGQGIKGLARQSGRNSFLPQAGGAIAGGLAGAGLGAKAGAFAGSAFGPAGTAIGGAIGGIAGGAYGIIKGSQTVSNAYGELSADRVQQMQGASERARSLRPSRLEALRGARGVSSADLNTLGTRGVEQGFSNEETMNQFSQAKGAFGSGAYAKAMLPTLQGYQNATGIGVGEQAQGIEALTGAGKGTRSSNAGVMVDILKKGVAAGMDVSKSGQFLKETTQLLQESQGMGRLDVGGISTRMGQYTNALSRDSEVTDTTIAQARQLESITKKESTSTSGLSGATNISATLQALGPNASAADFMNAVNLSSQATPEQAQELLGNKGAGVLKSKNALTKQNTGKSMFGDLYQPLMNLERGQTAEQGLGMQLGISGLNTQLNTGKAGERIASTEAGVYASPEAKTTRAEGRVFDAQLLEGMNNFTVDIVAASKGLKEFAEIAKKEAKEIQRLRVEAGN